MGACVSSNVCQGRSRRNRSSSWNNRDNGCALSSSSLNQNNTQNNDRNSNQHSSNSSQRNRLNNNNNNSSYRSPSFSNTASNVSNNNFSSSWSAYYNVPTGKNKKLKKDFHKYVKCDIKKLSETQLKAKRDEFWDTAPAFEGKPEIWSALKAAVDAIENQNFELAQAIIDSANIIVPNGLLNDCYDELGNRYQIPSYALVKPNNLLKNKLDKSKEKKSKTSIKLFDKKSKKNKKDSSEESDEDDDASSTNSRNKEGRNASEEHDEQIPIKLRVSSLTSENSDLKMLVTLNQTVLSLKHKLNAHNDELEPSAQRIYFGGRLLKDKDRLKAYRIRKNVVLQVIVRSNKETLENKTEIKVERSVSENNQNVEQN